MNTKFSVFLNFIFDLFYIYVYNQVLTTNRHSVVRRVNWPLLFVGACTLLLMRLATDPDADDNCISFISRPLPYYLCCTVVVFYCSADRNCDYAVCVFDRPSVRSSVCLSVCLFLCLFGHLLLRHRTHCYFRVNKTLHPILNCDIL